MSIPQPLKKLDHGFGRGVDWLQERIRTIQLEIPDELAKSLTRMAQSSGQTAEQVALTAIQQCVDPLARLNAALAPIRKAFPESGLTEDEAVEDFEREKHALRRERAAVKK